MLLLQEQKVHHVLGEVCCEALDRTRSSALDTAGKIASGLFTPFHVVDAANPPLCIFFGKAPLKIATQDYESRLATWNEWQPVSIEAYGS